jgi:hypothetical protein
MSDLFRDLAARVRDLDSAEARFEKFKSRKCDWDDPDDVNAYRRSRREKGRQSKLDKLVPDRVCPECKEIVLKTRSWRLVRHPETKKLMAVCSSCHQICYVAPRLDKEGELAKIRLKQALARTKGETVRFRMRGPALETAIGLAGMSKAHFSRRCGWSASYTQKLVGSDAVKTVNADTMRVILTVLKEGDVEFDMEETDYEAIWGVKPESDE